jgi:ankyrin repeat protein
MAAWGGRDAVVLRLISLRADVTTQDPFGRTAACFAFDRNHAAALDMLLNVRSKGGWTLLIDAAYGGATECVKVLLKRGRGAPSM